MNSLFLLPLCFCAAVDMADTVRVDIREQGRSIQHDGFLLEWNSASAKRFPRVGGTLWDAVLTPEGLCGYIRGASLDTCGIGHVSVSAGAGGRLDLPGVSLDSAAGGSAAWKVYAGEDDPLGTKSAEFLFPWNSLALDSAGNFCVRLHAGSRCGNARSILELTGTRYIDVAGSVFTRRVKIQLAVIALLLAAYLVLSGRIRRQNRRTESLRRST